jgi:hypothetical protein
VHAHKIQNDINRESREHDVLAPKQEFVVSWKVEGAVVCAAKAGERDYHVHQDIPIVDKIVFRRDKQIFLAAFALLSLMRPIIFSKISSTDSTQKSLNLLLLTIKLHQKK